MYFSKTDIQNADRIKRLNMINAISGIKPGNLIGTKSNIRGSNLAIFSSVVHLGSNPALFGFILRPNQEVRRHTYENICENGKYTINHIKSNFIKKAHYTSGKFDTDVSEFDRCQLTEEYIEGFEAPFVQESDLKLGLSHVESIPIKANNTMMVVGTVEHLIIPDHGIDKRGYIDLGLIDGIGISGLNSYYALNKIGEFPYVRINEVPDFSENSIG